MDLPLLTMVALIGAAFVAGWVDAVVGGGGLIQLPALLIGLPADTPVPSIAGTNKLSSVAGTATASATYLRKVAVTVASAAPLMACAYIGSTLGARLVHYLSKDVFTPVVLVALIGVGIYTVRRPTLGVNHELRDVGPRHYLTLAVIGLVIGGYDGLIGPGTGTFFVIAMVAMLGYGFLEASVLAKLANLTTNVAAIVVFITSGSIIWKLGLPMAAANLIGGFLGARTAIKFGSAFVRKVFLIVVTILGLRLAWDTVQMIL